MKWLILLSTFLCSTAFLFGQKYGNIWQFGNQVGIDFNDCEPALISGNNIGFEGCSTISDSTGQLLFYTNSDKVWNSQHNVMPNGNLLSSGGTISQVIIIPIPQSLSLFYIVTTKIQASGSLSLRYHVVDMSLNGGLGDVISMNNTLSTLNTTEQLCATYHENGTDCWLITHEYGTSNFLTYLITSSGISQTPVISSIGPAHTACISNINARGEIKFSPDGNKLAFNANGVGGDATSNILTICDFDKTSGLVSNPINLPFSEGEFGLSFSPDNTKLYGATWKAFNFTLSQYNYLYQFDLSSGNPATIVNSKFVIDSAQVPMSYGTLKIGPDGKIYVRSVNSNYLGVIHFPNLANTACNYVKEGFYVGPQTYQYGLNNYIEYSDYCDIAAIPTTEKNSYQISVFPNPFSSETIIQSDVFLHNATLVLENSMGQIVTATHPFIGQTVVLSRENLQPGLYIAKLTHDNNNIATIRLVIE